MLLQDRHADRPNSCDQTQSGARKCCIKKRKYDYGFIKFEFTYTGDQDYTKPRFIICGDVLANILKPSLLRRHLEARHSTQIIKLVDFFKGKMIESKSNVTNVISIAKGMNLKRQIE
jgi:hypothetical protein